MTEEAQPVVGTLDIEFVPSEQDTLRPDRIDAQGKAHVRFPVLDGSSVRIGRSRGNDIVIADSDISRFHAALTASVSGLVLSDLSSTNGTFVNGKRISTPIDLKSNDVITIGKAKMTVQLLLAQDAAMTSEASTKLADLMPTEVTVLLVDVCRYTMMSQALPADDVAQMLQGWFELVAPIISAHEGEIDKYIGDCVMAIWRNPRQPSSHLAAEAAKAAVEIVQRTREAAVSGAWPHHAQYPWRCRAAIHSGVALVGMVGGGNRRNYTVLGDNINVTFRIETIAGKLDKDIILSHSTAELIRAKAKLQSLGAHDLDGRSGEVELFELTGLID